MIFRCVLFALLVLFSFDTRGQAGIGTTKVDESAILEIQSENRGFLIPRMTTEERNAILTPVEGLMIYNTDRSAMQFFRERLGDSETLFGWYDTKCDSDINELLSSLPNGIILDLSQNGKLYKGIGGTGGEITASDTTGTNIGSIGPLPRNLNNLSNLNGYINFVNDNDEAGDLGSQSNDHKFIFKNEASNQINPYNSVTTLSRKKQTSPIVTDGIDLFMMTFSPQNYNDDIDIILVARIDALNPGNLASFFNNGHRTSQDGTFQLGIGSGNEPSNGVVPNGGDGCFRKYFTLRVRTTNGGSQNFFGYTNAQNDSRVPWDNNLHRFRIRYNKNTR
jgi:hypothetical protein